MLNISVCGGIVAVLNLDSQLCCHLRPPSEIMESLRAAPSLQIAYIQCQPNTSNCLMANKNKKINNNQIRPFHLDTGCIKFSCFPMLLYFVTAFSSRTSMKNGREICHSSAALHWAIARIVCVCVCVAEYFGFGKSFDHSCPESKLRRWIGRCGRDEMKKSW